MFCLQHIIRGVSRTFYRVLFQSSHSELWHRNVPLDVRANTEQTRRNRTEVESHRLTVVSFQDSGHSGSESEQKAVCQVLATTAVLLMSQGHHCCLSDIITLDCGPVMDICPPRQLNTSSQLTQSWTSKLSKLSTLPKWCNGQRESRSSEPGPWLTCGSVFFTSAAGAVSLNFTVWPLLLPVQHHSHLCQGERCQCKWMKTWRGGAEPADEESQFWGGGANQKGLLWIWPPTFSAHPGCVWVCMWGAGWDGGAVWGYMTSLWTEKVVTN